MKLSLLAALCTGALAFSVPVESQGIAPMVVGQQAPQVLRAGTLVPLRTMGELTTEGKRLRVGDRFDMEVSEPVQLNGRTVIAAGSRAIGEITSVRNKGMWGKSGDIEARVVSVRANDREMRLRGAFNDKGVTGTGAVVGALVVIPIAGFFVTGTSARIPSGSQIKGYLEEDLPVAFAEAPSAPMTIVSPPSAGVMAVAGSPRP